MAIRYELVSEHRPLDVHTTPVALPDKQISGCVDDVDSAGLVLACGIAGELITRLWPTYAGLSV
ncbi:hypothetical protein MVAC_03026 [Mycolicibacterium vaccae ATCC 25954]|uniref:Uncharacterized protein n=1 Tax=Mycolicibacterium vaccae ATCC 25954 TaxID=1194972 RepID=K0V420_MYCVA|nr:hypothetical protein MVAC_03026 [Mycolicibacterium vaccae ATCC 25954]